MFEAFYGFTQRSPGPVAPAVLFGSEQHQELLARLHYLVQSRGFGPVTGEVGSGKSAAVRALAATSTAPGTPCSASPNRASPRGTSTGTSGSS